MWNDYGVLHRVVPSCETTIEFQFEGEGTTTLFLQKKKRARRALRVSSPYSHKKCVGMQEERPYGCVISYGCMPIPPPGPRHRTRIGRGGTLDQGRRRSGKQSLENIPSSPSMQEPCCWSHSCPLVLADVALLVAKHVVPSRPPASTFHRRGSEAARSNPRPFPSILFMKLPVCTRRWMLDPVRCPEDPTPMGIVLGSVTAQGRIVLRDL